MKKFLMGLTVIVITTITIGAMYYFMLKPNNKVVSNENNLYKNEVVKNEDNKVNNKENVKNKEDEKENSDSKKEELIKKPEENKEVLKPSKENNYDKAEKEKVSKVFKVNKYTLLQNLSMKDKVKLLYTCRGLSTIDMGNIKEYMKSSNEVEASAEIFKILRQRLSKDDYNEIKKILTPYVNIDYIESNI